MTLPQKGYLLSCFGLLVCISAVFLMEGRYYQDNVYHGWNLFFAILWILSGIFGLLCLVYMIRCVDQKTLAGPGSGFGVFAGLPQPACSYGDKSGVWMHADCP